jgi:hypothetical protein
MPKRRSYAWQHWAALLLIPLAGCRSTALKAPVATAVHRDASFTQFFRRTSGWIAGDGAISIPCSDGQVLWLFGDSHVDDYDPTTGSIPCLFQTRNAALIHHRNDLENAVTLVGRGPGFRSFFKASQDDSEWFWPLSGFQNGEVVYVYLAALRKTAAGGMWGFESAGRDYWAKIKFPELRPVMYAPLPDLHGIAFGVGFVVDGDYTYAYGGKQNGLASDVYVARFKSIRPEDDWQFWDGRAWNPAVTNAAVIARGASTSLHVCRVRNRILLTTSALSLACDQGREIFMATSHDLVGPFAPLKKIFSVDDEYLGHYPFNYFPIAHPEFLDSSGELLVTYSINNYEPCVPACVNGRANPDHYRPKAVRVPLHLVDPGL